MFSSRFTTRQISEISKQISENLRRPAACRRAHPYPAQSTWRGPSMHKQIYAGVAMLRSHCRRRHTCAAAYLLKTAFGDVAFFHVGFVLRIAIGFVRQRNVPDIFKTPNLKQTSTLGNNIDRKLFYQIIFFLEISSNYYFYPRTILQNFAKSGFRVQQSLARTSKSES